MSPPRDERLYESLRRLILEEVTDESSPADTMAPEGDRPGGRRFGRYVLLEAIGEGASSRVHRALHVDLEKTVAVKIMKHRTTPGGGHYERFRKEALTAAQLEHPGIIAVHDVGVVGDEAYLAMDLVEGPTLRAWLEDGTRSLDQRLEIVEDVARAVEAAHRGGVVHRDLKPENVLVTGENRPVVVDFGLARASNDPRITREGAPLGTPVFMAPEQVRGDLDAVGPRTDVYALGVLLYEVLTGRLPFTGAEPAEVYRRIEREAPKPPSALAPELPADLDAIALRCLEKDPRDRYSSAASLADDLRAVRAGEPVSARPRGLLSRVGRSALRNPLRLGLFLVLLALGAAGTWLGARAWQRHEVVSRALEIESSSAAAASRLRHVLVRAGDGRPQDETEAEGLVKEARRILENLRAPSGVRAAYGLLIDHHLGDRSHEDPIAAARRDHPDDPLVPLFGARVCLFRYLERVQWPAVRIPYHGMGASPEMPRMIETDEMRMLRVRASALVQEARGNDLWPHLSARWIEELRAGLEAFARGRLEACITHLEPLKDRADAEVEVHLLIALSRFRCGDLEGCLAATRSLVQRRPGHRGARRWLLAGLIVAAELGLMRGDEVGPLLREAREQLKMLGAEAHRAERAELALIEGMMRERRGQPAVTALEQAVADYRVLRFRKPVRLPWLMNLAAALKQLDRQRPHGRARLEEALAALIAAERLAPDDYQVLFNRIGMHLDVFKRRARTTTVPETAWTDLDADIDRCASQGASELEIAYLRLFRAFCRAEALRPGEEPELDRLLDALDRMEVFLDRWPQVSEVRQLTLVTRLRVAGTEPEPEADELEDIAEEVHALAAAAPRYRFLEDHLPRLLDRARLKLLQRARQRRPETLEAPRRLTLLAIAEWTAVAARRRDDPEPPQRLAEAQQDMHRLEPERSEHWITRALTTTAANRARFPDRTILHVQEGQLALMLARHADTAEDRRDELRERAQQAARAALELEPGNASAQAILRVVR